MTQPTPGRTGADESFAPALMGAFRAGVNVLEDGLHHIRDQWNNLINTINAFLDRVRRQLEADHWWSKVAEWFTDDIADALRLLQASLERARQAVDTILAAMEKAVNGSVPVFSLFEVGMDWATRVNASLSDMAPDLTPSGAIDNWRGPAHETYKARVQDQGDAIDATVGKVKATSGWLAEVGQANVEYVADLAAKTAGLLKNIVAMTTDAAEAAATDVLAVQQAANHLSEFLGEVAVQVADMMVSLASRLADVLAKITEIAGEYGDHTGLPGGRWAPAVNA